MFILQQDVDDLLHLTHLSLDKMAAITQMIFSEEFLWMKRFWFL